METIRNLKIDILSKNWYTLKKATYEFLKSNGQWQKQVREVYDRGNGAAILLYNPKKKTIILTEQFRIPTYLNGNETGLMIEVCAGVLEEDNPADCIKREVEEETGYKVEKVEKVMEAYMSPGAVTEILYFFTAEYSEEMKISDGGGLASEQENIKVLEYAFDKAFDMIKTGEIKDAKSILLLQHAKINGLV